MYRNHSVGVVVPAYNEEGDVGTVIDTLPEYVDRAYVVDDASTDGTPAEIEAHADQVNAERTPDVAEFDDVVVPVTHDENRGVGGAIKTGYRRAREERIEVTTVLGGDAQMDPTEMTRYLDPVVEGRAAYAKGNRFAGPADYEGMPRFRLAGNLMLSYLTKISSGYWKSMDPQNGYTAISLRALEATDLEELYEDYGFANDLLAKLNAENLRIADVARSSEFAYDGEWDSHIDLGAFVPQVSGLLLRDFVWRLNRKYLLRDFHPLALFYYLGMATGGIALGGLGATLVGEDASGPARWLGLLLVAVSLFLVGATLDATDNEDLETQVVPGSDGVAPTAHSGEPAAAAGDAD